jgi:hypothetical protein
MPQAIASYTTRVSGLWNTRHEIFTAEGGRVGVLSMERNGKGLVVRGVFVPEKGEKILLRRDPGLLRSQFSFWTEGREWLGSSLRWSFVGREIVLSTGAKPYRLLPLPSFRPGWRLVAPKTGEMARILPSLLRTRSRIEVYRRVDFELALFAYFLGWQLHIESLWPGKAVELEPENVPTPSKA